MSDATTNTVVTGLNLLTDSTGTDALAPASSFVNQLLDVSPPVAMALVLACFYAFTPTTLSTLWKAVVDMAIIGVGAAVYPQLADPDKVGFAVHNPIAAEVVTGALLGCGALILSVPVRKLLTKLGFLPNVSNLNHKEPNVNPPPPAPPVTGPTA